MGLNLATCANNVGSNLGMESIVRLNDIIIVLHFLFIFSDYINYDILVRVGS